jgi:hypothetical protein
MRTRALVVILVITSVACSPMDVLEIPVAPPPPSHWSDFSTATIPGTDCPVIEGIYLEPPLIYRIGVDAKSIPGDSADLYTRYIPFRLAEREESAVNEMRLNNNSFAIRQPDATEFYFSYFIETKNILVEYHFQSEKGNFECRNGHIEFPKITSYGVLEGMSVNFQIKNILLKDDQGALVIQSTRGPYRGNASKATKKFMFEFIKYPPK